jgi:hypothetical protein
MANFSLNDYIRLRRMGYQAGETDRRRGSSRFDSEINPKPETCNQNQKARASPLKSFGAAG